MKPGFIDKLLRRLERLRPEEVQRQVLRLVREKGFLETIFNTIQEGIIVTDLGGRIVYLNVAAAGFFALDPEASIGKPLAEGVRGLDWSALVSLDGEPGKTVSRDMEVFYPVNRYLNFYAVPLNLEEGGGGGGRRDRRNPAPPMETPAEQRFGYAMIVRDITESRRSAQETLESERLNALTLLAAGVAHEIGNPLNSLTIHLQLMERQLRRLPAEAARERAGLEESVRVARDEIRRLDFIVSQFLRAIRPQGLTTRREDVNEVVRESVSFLEMEIRDRDIIVETDLAEGLPALEIDRDQIKQAFYNVIRNAFQAMRTGGILRITSALEGDFVTIVFTDTGGGIDPESMGRIFEPYWTTKSGGTGLGLLIVRRIVRAHGGEIGLESDAGRGLAFTIRLPHGDRRVRMLALSGGEVAAGDGAPVDLLGAVPEGAS